MLRSLKVQIYLLVFIPLIIIAALGLYSQINSTRIIEAKVSDMTSDNILKIEQKRLVTVIESANSLIKPYLDMPGNTG